MEVKLEVPWLVLVQEQAVFLRNRAKSSASELGKKLLLRRQKNLAKEEEEK